MRRQLAILVGLVLLPAALLPTAAAVAQADPQTPPTGPDQGASPENIEATQEARRLFMSGMEHFQERRFREAITDFEQASQRVPSADLWFNIARAHEELSEHELAIENYRLYLRDRVDPPDRAEVEQHIASLQERAEAARQARVRRPTTGTLRVSASAEGAGIRVDGRDVGRAPLDVPLSLPPGRHRISISQEGYLPFEAEVAMEAGVTTAAYAELQPATQYRTVGGGRIFTWIVGGLAVAAIGASTFFAIRAEGQRADAADQTDLALRRQGFDDAVSSATVSDVFLGTAIALGLGTAILWFVEGQSAETERVAGPAAQQARARAARRVF